MCGTFVRRIFSGILFLFWARKQGHLRRAWLQILDNRLAVISLVILSTYLTIALLDSIHFQRIPQQLETSDQGNFPLYTQSLLDVAFFPLGQQYEKTYSAPFSLYSYVMEAELSPDGERIQMFPKLEYAGIGVYDSNERYYDILVRVSKSIFFVIPIWLSLVLLFTLQQKIYHKQSVKAAFFRIVTNQTTIPWRLTFLCLLCVFIIITISFNLSHQYHIFGTDKIGQDVFYQAIKSIRTGLVIGTVTTLIMLPFAICLGLSAGYFSGWVDDVIQYIYTTLSSIPGVLLISAAILSIQIFIANHPQYFYSLEQQEDARLLALCLILGITSWTSLCRLLRAETLKLREIDYMQAAIALGSRRITILAHHVLPNVMHIILITLILDFSMLVLAEAVLSYIGVGVAPTTMSWGNMINSARLELAREPIVWWPILAAFIFMFILVLTANLFADAVRDALDPRFQMIK